MPAPSPSQGEGWGEGGSQNASPGAGSSRVPWLGFILSATLGVYTHFFGFFVLGLAVLYAFMRLAADWRAGERARVRRTALALLLSLAAIAVLYLPWVPVLLNFFGENYAENPYGQSWQANLRPGTMLNMLTLMLGGYWAHPVVRWATRALFTLGWLLMARRRPLAAAFTFLTVAIPFSVVSVLNPGHFVTERYFIFMLPMLLLCMAEALLGLAGLATAALQRLLGNRAQARYLLAPLLAAFLVVPLLGASGLERYYREPPKPAWRLLARYVSGTVPTGDLIVVATFPHWDKEPLQHYLKMGGRRVLYAAEEPKLRQILAEERSHPWWIVYAGSERRLGRFMSSKVGAHFNVVPFDYLAVVRRNDDSPNSLDDGRLILHSLAPRIPPPYQGEVQRVITGLGSPTGDMGQPIPSPIPTTVR